MKKHKNDKRREWGPRVNHKIRIPQIRVLTDDGKMLGIMSPQEAMKIAKKHGLDLVEISPNSDPPVCKVIDYSKFKYSQKKKQKSIKSNSQKNVLKEIRFGPNTDEHDFNFKLNHAKKFLGNGFKVKAYVHFYGRTIVFKERGEILLLRLAQELDDFSNVEELPRLEGKRMFLMLTPKK